MKPFKSPIFNTLEEREIICSIVTVYSGVFFLSSGHSSMASLAVFFLIVIVNFYFFTFLGWTFLKCSKLQKPWLIKIAWFLQNMAFVNKGMAMETQITATRTKMFDSKGKVVQKNPLNSNERLFHKATSKRSNRLKSGG